MTTCPADQRGMWWPARLAWTPALAGACTRRHALAGCKERGQRAGDAVAAARREPRDACLGHGAALLGGVKRARPHKGRAHQATRRGAAHPHPGPPRLAVGQACASRVRLPRVRTPKAGPPRVQGPLGHRPRPQPMVVAGLGWRCRTLEPSPHGLFGHAEPQAAAGPLNTDQEPLADHPHRLCRGTQIAKDRRACLSKVRRARVATQEAAFAAWGERRSDSAHVALLQASIIGTCGIGARLAPIFGFPPRSILR